MIQRYFRRRWVEPDRNAAVVRMIVRTKQRRGPIDWYLAWDVRTFGEEAGSTPWWLKPIAAFVLWLSDWQTIWQMRPGDATEIWRKSRESAK